MPSLILSVRLRCSFFFVPAIFLSSVFLIINLAVPGLSCQVALVVKNLPAKAGDVEMEV